MLRTYPEDLWFTTAAAPRRYPWVPPADMSGVPSRHAGWEPRRSTGGAPVLVPRMPDHPMAAWFALGGVACGLVASILWLGGSAQWSIVATVAGTLGFTCLLGRLAAALHARWKSRRRALAPHGDPGR